MAGTTLFDKLWQEHCVAELDDGGTLLYIDRVFLHERTGSIALQSLREAGRPVRDPSRAFCVMDHIVDTLPGRGDGTRVPGGTDFIRSTRDEAQRAAIQLIDIDDPRQGIVHVISPEQGVVLPGVTLVCPDSHTCAQGAFGALAWGIGSSEAEHALATQTLRINRPRTLRVNFTGSLAPGVTAKDMVLHLIAQHGAAGGAGYAIEFAGEAIEALDVEARMTLCNMAVEFSAFCAIVAPDDKTLDYLAGAPLAPSGDAWEAACAYWRTLRSDDDAVFDREIEVDCDHIKPMVTWGNTVEQAAPLVAGVPELERATAPAVRQAWQRGLDYMGLHPGDALDGVPIEAAFIGSCTNSRLSDLRAAAEVLRGRRVRAGVTAICVPGSCKVKRDAEAEGLDRVFIEAGFEWREPGCSMCFYAGGESFGHRQRVVSSTNRNFESRQGPQTRTHLASPATVAASAIAGCLTTVAGLDAHAERYA